MGQNFIKYIYKYFDKLVEKYEFRKQNELSDNQTYSIEYSSKVFVIKLEKYRREFYVTVYKLNDLDSEINLFNLLEYMKQDSIVDIPESKYFREEKNIEECFEKQLKHISTVIYENYNAINNYFNNNNYKSKIADFEKYWRNKHPELYG